MYCCVAAQLQHSNTYKYCYAFVLQLCSNSTNALPDVTTSSNELVPTRNNGCVRLSAQHALQLTQHALQLVCLLEPKMPTSAKKQAIDLQAGFTASNRHMYICTYGVQQSNVLPNRVYPHVQMTIDSGPTPWIVFMSLSQGIGDQSQFSSAHVSICG